MSTEPVSPAVATAIPDVSGHVAEINACLSKPWTDYDRATGRWYDVAGICRPTSARPSCAPSARRGGASRSSHQHDGDSLVFKPLTPTPTGETT
jgi:hypothetical protein